MDLKGVHKFFEALGNELEKLGINTTYVEGAGAPQIGDTLRILFPVTDEGHAAITEVMVSELEEDLNMLHIYSTIVVELNEKADELPNKLIEWNLLCPLGGYGLYEEERQLYHKYTMPFNINKDPESLADDTMTLLELLFNVLTNAYPDYSVYAAE
ncbi:MAG: hypothetical protein E7211_20820 [Clostridium lundense]|jgi:hypothetical protein|nr:hypothetical protein [Clostridium lundense]